MPRTAAPPPPPVEPAVEVGQPEARTCQAPGCDTALPTSGPGWHWRRFCNEHQPESKKKKVPAGRRPRADRPPKALAPPAPPKARTRKEELDQVERNAKWLIDMAAQLGMIYAAQASQPVLALDLADVQGGSPGVAKALRNVAEYEEWLRRALSGGRGSDRAQAWLGLIMVCGTVAMPILVRHGKIQLPAGLMPMFAPGQGPAVEPDAPDAEPVTA